MWYALQTETGKEDELLKVIGLLVNPNLYTRCFSIKRESVRRLQGQCVQKTERMFPGYIIVETENPLEVFERLRGFPMYVRLLGKEGTEVYAITQEEEEFLRSLLQNDMEDTVRRSPVVTDKKGEIRRYGGALAQYKNLIVKKRIRLRYVIIRKEILGSEREIFMGIRLFGDDGESAEEFQKLFDASEPEKMSPAEEAAFELPEGLEIESKVLILDGPLAGFSGTVKEIDFNRRKVVIEVELFGRKTMVYADKNTRLDLENTHAAKG